MLLLVIALLAAFTDALWIGENLSDGVKAESEKNCPVFRKAFDLPSEPVEAKVTAAGLGFFEVYVNGEKVGDEVLAPAACDWTHRCYYYVWDVGSRLRKGANEVRVWTAPGYSDDFFQYGWRRVAECPKRTKLSLEGVLSDGACGRTLRDRGWAVKGISLRGLRPGVLSVADTPIVIAALGNDAPTKEQAAALVEFRRAGGRLVYISGQDPTAGHDREASGRPLAIGKGDPLDISGMADFLVDRKCEELPVSPGWHREGACPDWTKMALVMDGRRYPLRRDANSDGWSKPACAQEVRLADGIEPIAYLDNGSDRFCVAARRGNVTWLPIYMLSPFLFSDDTSLDFGSLRLDSFAERVLMAALE